MAAKNPNGTNSSDGEGPSAAANNSNGTNGAAGGTAAAAPAAKKKTYFAQRTIVHEDQIFKADGKPLPLKEEHLQHLIKSGDVKETPPPPPTEIKKPAKAGELPVDPELTKGA